MAGAVGRMGHHSAPHDRRCVPTCEADRLGSQRSTLFARATGQMAKGGEGYKTTGVSRSPVVPTLEDLGVDENLAKKARKAAAMSEEEFEQSVEEHVAISEVCRQGHPSRGI